MQGKLIVIEGADASGKQTQAELLVKALRKEGREVEQISFPRYSSFFGELVEKYLKGEFGALDKVPAEIPSLLYALDRIDARKQLEEWLAGGKIVVCDRFTASNIAHQAVKIPKEERKEFIAWLKGVESRLPKPALTVYLDVPVPVSQSLLDSRGEEKDLHESNIAYLESVRLVFLELALGRGWERVECAPKNKLLSIEDVHKIVLEKALRYV